jgi:hypothetical protein
MQTGFGLANKVVVSYETYIVMTLLVYRRLHAFPDANPMFTAPTQVVSISLFY